MCQSPPVGGLFLCVDVSKPPVGGFFVRRCVKAPPGWGAFLCVDVLKPPGWRHHNGTLEIRPETLIRHFVMEDDLAAFDAIAQVVRRSIGDSSL